MRKIGRMLVIGGTAGVLLIVVPTAEAKEKCAIGVSDAAQAAAYKPIQWPPDGWRSEAAQLVPRWKLDAQS